MIAQGGNILENQEAWAQGIKIGGAAARGVQIYSAPNPKVNLLSNNIADWESGHYATNGVKAVFVSRIRLAELLPIPHRNLYFNVYGPSDSYRFILRTFNENLVFLTNVGEAYNGYISSFANNAAYLAITIYDANNTALTFADYYNLFSNSAIKPWISIA